MQVFFWKNKKKVERGEPVRYNMIYMGFYIEK